MTGKELWDRIGRSVFRGGMPCRHELIPIVSSFSTYVYPSKTYAPPCVTTAFVSVYPEGTTTFFDVEIAPKQNA